MGASGIPHFGLYGEAVAGAQRADLLHIESVQSRSRLHHWEIEPHTHQGLHQVVWLRSGPAVVSLDDAQTPLEGPLAVVIPPGTVHGFRFAPDSDGFVLTLSPRMLVEGDLAGSGDALLALFRQARAWRVPDDAVDRLAALFEALAAESAEPQGAGSPVPVWLARSLVWRLAQLAEREARAVDAADRALAQGEQALFTRFLLLLEQHHSDHWAVADYARRLGLSPQRLNRLVRAETGRPTLQVIHDRLMREARRRLVHLAAPVSSVAYDLGFEDPAYFCRFFKRHTGHSPRAFKQQRQG